MFVFAPCPTKLVRVAKNGGLEIVVGTAKPGVKVMGFVLKLGLFHTRASDPFT